MPTAGKLLWTVPLRSPYGVNVATPVYGAGRIFYTTPYVYGTCYQLPPGGRGRSRRKPGARRWIPAPARVLLVDGLLYGSGYQKHKSWLCLDWQSGEIALRVQGPDDRRGRVCRRAALLPGRGRPGGPVTARRRASSRSPANSGSCPSRLTMPGRIRSCSTAGCTSATTIRSGATK